MTPSAPAAFTCIAADGSSAEVARSVASEVPVALEVNGFGYAVLMATPCDLEDLATGFALSDGLIDVAADIATLTAHQAKGGVILRLTVRAALAERIAERLRPRLSDSSCGLCGLENIERVLRPLPPVDRTSRAAPPAVFRALAEIGPMQVLNRETGAVHGAALAAADGTIRLLREDIGRHNALDKLIGAMRRQGLGWDGGFALTTSRCSYELVEKAVLAGCPMLATMSAPTGLALSRAADAGMAVICLAREDSLLRAGD